MFDEQVALQEKGEQIRARHIVVDTEEKANELRNLVEQGGDFSRLAKEFSLDQSTRDLGGDLGFFGRGALDNLISDKAFSLETGEMSAPFQTNMGWHILKVEARRQTPTPSFEKLKPEIVNFMSYDAIQELVTILRQTHNVSIVASIEAAPQDGSDAEQNEINDEP
jgi:peptidyl-prolyl cis-trans isomerase C